MSANARGADNISNRSAPTGRHGEGLLAAGGLVGAVLATSCCVVPLLLLSLGIGGAWIGNLTALSPYKPLFVTVSLGLLGGAYWSIHRTPSTRCEPGTPCASGTANRVTRAALWVATALVLLAVTIDLWAPLFY